MRRATFGFFVENSGNGKLGHGVHATYAPISQTCPSTCPLKGAGCYAQSGNVGVHNARREAYNAGTDPVQLAILEAAEIDLARSLGVSGPLRIHVSGDSTTVQGTRALSDAARRWRGKVWSYTHAWRTVNRDAWGTVSCLASCETLHDAVEALSVGYAPAIVVPEFKNGAKSWKERSIIGDLTVIPCPAQTLDRDCSQCRLCWDDVRLNATNSVIAFSAHGTGAKKLKRRLQLLA